MSERKINLEEILNNQISKDFNFRLFYGESTTNNVIKAMKESCKQVLELAAHENAEINYIGRCPEIPVVDEQSILNTINQIE